MSSAFNTKKLYPGTYLVFELDVVRQIEIVRVTEFCYQIIIDNGTKHWVYIERFVKIYHSIIEEISKS